MDVEKDYLKLPLCDFISAVASRSPTPGGGSVAAVVGAMATSLACMVIEFTVGKPKFAEHDSRLREALAVLKTAGERFAELATEDMRAYEGVVAARKADAAAQEQASMRATAVPMEMVSLSADVLVRLDDLKDKTNHMLLGDLRAAAALASAAGESAAGMVRDNLGTADPTQVAKLEQDLQRLQARSEQCRQSVISFQVMR